MAGFPPAPWAEVVLPHESKEKVQVRAGPATEVMFPASLNGLPNAGSMSSSLGRNSASATDLQLVQQPNHVRPKRIARLEVHQGLRHVASVLPLVTDGRGRHDPRSRSRTTGASREACRRVTQGGRSGSTCSALWAGAVNG